MVLFRYFCGTINQQNSQCPMKKLFILLFVVFGLLVFADASAKDKKDKNDDVVSVTMLDGTVEKGVVTKSWGGFKFKSKDFNRAFTVKTDDGRELKLNAADVDSIYFPLRGDDKMKTYRVHTIAFPSLGNRNATKQWIAGEARKSEHAKIVVTNIWVNVRHVTYSAWDLRALPCILFEGDSVAYPFYYYDNGNFNISVMKHWLNKKNPELYKHIETYFKTNKKAKKEVGDNWNIMLDACEGYFTKTDDE